MKKIIKNNKKVLLFIFIIISLFSLFNTIKKGLKNGSDFQWYPSKLFWEGINHYRYIIDGGKVFLSQGGEYGHLLQIIFYPFILVEWNTARLFWLIINVFLAFLIPYIICRSFKIHTNKILLIILIFITCYPTRMTINYGQQSLFVLFFLILPFLKSKNYSYFLSGFSYVKYSTGYIIFLNYLVEKKFKNLIFATLPIFLGWTFYFAYTKSNPIQNFFDPFELILKKNYFQSADLYSLLNIYLFGTNNILNKFFIIFTVVIFNLFFLLKIKKIQDNLVKMSLIFILPLIFMPHSNYDYVLLLPLLILAISNFNLNISKFNFYFVIYYFYFNRIVKHSIESYILIINKNIIFNIFIFISLFLVLFLNVIHYSKIDKLRQFFRLK
jgi:hypothetical protein